MCQQAIELPVVAAAFHILGARFQFRGEGKHLAVAEHCRPIAAKNKMDAGRCPCAYQHAIASASANE